jgi:hypothetical protein
MSGFGASFATEKVSSSKDWQDKSSIQNYRESSGRVHIDHWKETKSSTVVANDPDDLKER